MLYNCVFKFYNQFLGNHKRLENKSKFFIGITKIAVWKFYFLEQYYFCIFLMCKP